MEVVSAGFKEVQQALDRRDVRRIVVDFMHSVVWGMLAGRPRTMQVA
jgi:hypothetical protein